MLQPERFEKGLFQGDRDHDDTAFLWAPWRLVVVVRGEKIRPSTLGPRANPFKAVDGSVVRGLRFFEPYEIR
ncbi:hypothetical protein [Desulfosoma sp.]